VFRVSLAGDERVDDPPLNSAARRARLPEHVRSTINRVGAAAVGRRGWYSDSVDHDGVTWLVTGAPIDRATAQVMLLPVSVDADPARIDEVAPGITRREREVLLLSLRGRAPREIALQLDISWHTVRTHLKRAYRHLGVSSRGEAIALVLERARPRVDLRLIEGDGEPDGRGQGDDGGAGAGAGSGSPGNGGRRR
jgi:DNA-binding CsgD family transcriptional regulator